MAKASILEEQFTSVEAARASGVPFFTVDYWDRTRLLNPTVSKGTGRGRGRERVYSYSDVLRLAIARALRNEQVSLETLRRVVTKLGDCGPRLCASRYVLIDRSARLVQTPEALIKILEKPGRRRTFAVLLDLTVMRDYLHARTTRLIAARDALQARR